GRPDQIATFRGGWGEFRLWLRSRRRVELQDCPKFLRRPLDEFPVRVRERVLLVRVDVDLGDRGVPFQNRDDDLGARVDETLQVSRIGRHILDDDRLLLRHRRSAEALAVRYSDWPGR